MLEIETIKVVAWTCTDDIAICQSRTWTVLDIVTMDLVINKDVDV
jgi:hypothetical protein